ncbi:MAG: ankyrin repeat domain-containing protein [Gemmatimonadetes bacterium]|nr:ankyrin repeat domain-containing protein [Gemmatimonadota bacterium]
MRNGMHANLLGALTVVLLLGVPAPESPVADAAMAGDIETVRSLLRDGEDVNAAQPDGMTALHWAAMKNNVAMAELLLYAGANGAATTRLGGYTPLHLASREGVGDAVDVLLEAGSAVGTMTSTGVSAIHLAAQAGRPDAIRALLEHGADVNARDTYADRTPLIFATAQNRLDAMATLIGAGADIALTTTVKDYPAIAEVDNEDRARRTRIKRAARDPEPEDERPPGQGRPGAQRQARPAQADTTAQAAPDTVAADTATAVTDTAAVVADTATAVADTAGQIPQYPPEPDHPTTPPDPDSLAAARRGGTAGAPRSLSYTELVGRQGGMSAFHYAARDGRIDAARMLLDAGADIDQVTDGDHSTPLLVAIINGNFDLALMLLEAGADPTITSEDGAAPLFATINNEWALRTWYPQPTASQQQETSYLDLMETLLLLGADPNARVKTHIWYASYNAGRMGVDFAGATAFWRAAYATDVAAMRLLAEHGADPNIRTIKPAARRRYGSQPDTSTSDTTETDPSGLEEVPVGGPAVHPLHAASGVGYGTSRVGQQHRHVPDGWLPAVTYLVAELGLDVNVRDHDAYSALHHAAARGDNAVIEFLVAQGADVTFVSRRGQTTVDMANGPQQRVQPFPETIALLESLGAENNHNCRSC